jgi:origin recognition complex subunit 5
MIAIIGALLEENDIDGRLVSPQFSIPGEFTGMEINRIGVFSAVRISFLSLFFIIQTFLQFR